MMWEWHGGWALWWMGLVMVVFWASVALVIVALVRQSDGRRRAGRDAESVLDERFGRGEIDEDEYRRRRDLIQH
jgi:putative membrane protein